MADILLRLSGGAFLLVGLFMFLYGPSDRIQTPQDKFGGNPMGDLARVLGLGFMAIGIIMIKW